MALRKIPAYDQVPDDELSAIKERARAAWRDCQAKAANLVPVTVTDRLWVNGISAVEAAPDSVRAVMRLLIDQGRWGSLDPPSAPKPPKIHSAAAVADVRRRMPLPLSRRR
jgi:hypothetical protein